MPKTSTLSRMVINPLGYCQKPTVSVTKIVTIPYSHYIKSALTFNVVRVWDCYDQCSYAY